MTVRLLMAAKTIAEEWPSPTTKQMTFKPIHRASFPPYTAGAHIQVQHENGTRRDYSLVGPTDGTTYTVAVRRDDRGRGGSVLLHDWMNVGDIAFVSYPQSGMRLDTAARHIFIAGGIGVTGVMSLVASVPSGANAEVHYCVRTRAEAAYVENLVRTGARVVVHESSRDGRLDVAALLTEVPAETSLYYCGPPSLMEAIDSNSSHWPSGRVHSETFVGSAPAVGERLGDSFDAWLVASQKMIHVKEDESLLHAMLRENVPIEYSCEGGVCDTCLVDLLEGVVDHRDLSLSDAERVAVMTTCVSRGRGTISVNA